MFVLFYRYCLVNYSCLLDVGFNFNYGYMSFDYFGWVIMMLFQFVILDFWENVYNNVSYLKFLFVVKWGVYDFFFCLLVSFI